MGHLIPAAPTPSAPSSRWTAPSPRPSAGSSASTPSSPYTPPLTSPLPRPTPAPHPAPEAGTARPEGQTHAAHLRQAALPPHRRRPAHARPESRLRLPGSPPPPPRPLPASPRIEGEQGAGWQMGGLREERSGVASFLNWTRFQDLSKRLSNHFSSPARKTVACRGNAPNGGSTAGCSRTHRHQPDANGPRNFHRKLHLTESSYPCGEGAGDLILAKLQDRPSELGEEEEERAADAELMELMGPPGEGTDSVTASSNQLDQLAVIDEGLLDSFREGSRFCPCPPQPPSPLNTTTLQGSPS